MKSEHIQLQTSDNLLLPGLLFEPGRKSKRAAIYLHGMGSSIFYTVNYTNALAASILGRGIAFLPFNNRGAHLIQHVKVAATKKVPSKTIGMTHELIKDCIKDIEAAIKFLHQRGYKELYLVGHSTGANKICVYNFYKTRNSITKYVLLGGGDDTGLHYQTLGKRKFHKLLNETKRNTKTKHVHDLIPGGLGDPEELFSYASAYDILNPNGDYNTFPFLEVIDKVKLSTKPLFREYKSIKKPTLVIYGGKDEYCYGKVPQCIEILKQYAAVPDKFEFKTINNADHSFYGRETQLAKAITEWLEQPI